MFFHLHWRPLYQKPLQAESSTKAVLMLANVLTTDFFFYLSLFSGYLLVDIEVNLVTERPFGLYHWPRWQRICLMEIEDWSQWRRHRFDS